jgi:hypothetical protein
LKCAQMNETSHCTVCGSTVNDIMKIFKVWGRIRLFKKGLEQQESHWNDWMFFKMDFIYLTWFYWFYLRNF